MDASPLPAATEVFVRGHPRGERYRGSMPAQARMRRARSGLVP
jgi:hypothetical protein